MVSSINSTNRNCSGLSTSSVSRAAHFVGHITTLRVRRLVRSIRAGHQQDLEAVRRVVDVASRFVVQSAIKNQRSHCSLRIVLTTLKVSGLFYHSSSHYRAIRISIQLSTPEVVPVLVIDHHA